MRAKVEFPMGRKLFHLVVSPGTSRCPTAQGVIKFLTSRSTQYISLLDVIVSEYGEMKATDWNLKKKRLNSKWREKRVSRKIAGILVSEYEPLNKYCYHSLLSTYQLIQGQGTRGAKVPSL